MTACLKTAAFFPVLTALTLVLFCPECPAYGFPAGDDVCVDRVTASVPASADSVMTPASSDTALLVKKLEEYLCALDRLDEAEACAEADFIISNVMDSTLRNLVAVRSYRHFRNSPVMGSESVAIYLYDNWFANFRAVFDDIDELDEAELFAFVNRSSLIGRKAPEVKFTDMEADTVAFPLGGRRPTVLYFYSVTCPKCLYTSHQLRKYMGGRHPKLNFVAVYTGEDLAGMQRYVAENLNVRQNCRTRVRHLAATDGDWVTAYGVVQTPRLFLLDRRGVIVGRSLDVPSLELLLETGLR